MGYHSFYGQLCHGLTTLSVKKFPLTSNLNIPLFSLKPFTLILSLSTCECCKTGTERICFSLFTFFFKPIRFLQWQMISVYNNSDIKYPEELLLHKMQVRQLYM